MNFDVETQKGNAEAVLDIPSVRNALKREVGDTPPSVDDLKNRLDEAKVELQDAIEEADIDRMNAARAEIKSLPEQITISEMRELKLRLEAIEAEIQTVEENKTLWRQVRLQSKNELLAKEEELRPYYEKYNKCGFELSLADNEYQILLVERREKKARLFGLSTDLKKEN